VWCNGVGSIVQLATKYIGGLRLALLGIIAGYSKRRGYRYFSLGSRLGERFRVLLFSNGILR
jgi:hypothetical protein